MNKSHWYNLPVGIFILMVFCSSFAYGQGEVKPVKVDPAAEKHFRQGMVYASQKLYDNAILEYKKAIEIYPLYADAYANLGVVYIQQQKYNLALENLKQAVELDEKAGRKNGLAYYNLAVVHSLRDELDLGIEALNVALEKGFNNIEALRNDPDLKNLRRSPEYTKTLEKHHIFLK